MSTQLSSFEILLADLQTFESKTVPNFENEDSNYPQFSTLTDFENGYWGPATENNTKLYHFTELKDRIAGVRMQAVLDMQQSGQELISNEEIVAACDEAVLASSHFESGGQEFQQARHL